MPRRLPRAAAILAAFCILVLCGGEVLAQKSGRRATRREAKEATAAQAAATAPATETQTEAPPTPQVQPLILPGESPDLILFQTGDVLGYLSPCG